MQARIRWESVQGLFFEVMRLRKRAFAQQDNAEPPAEMSDAFYIPG
jgi:hypothetical protein